MPNIITPKESQVRGKLITAGLKPYYTQIANFGYLSLLQVFNMALPLLTYPYLIKVLGTETYGMVIYAQAIIGYLVVLVNFGFNTTATKEISINRDNIEKLSEITSSIYIIKGTLFLVSILILFISLIWVEAQYSTLFYLTLWMCLYEFLFPLWYFQGVEKMKYITIITLLSRVSFLLLVFTFVKNSEDFLRIPIINGVGSLASCFISFAILKRNKIIFRWQSFNTLLHYIKNSYIMALSYGTNIIKTNLHIVIVKHLFTFSEVVFVDVAMKITNLGITFLDLISQAVFPKMSILKDINFFKKVFLLSLAISIIMMATIQLFSSQIVTLLGGSTMLESIKLTKILALNLPVYIAGALLGRNCLLIHGFDRQILASMFYSGLLYLFLILSYSLAFSSPSLTTFAYIYLISFLFETYYRYLICRRKQLF